jgi:hypothetical protein
VQFLTIDWCARDNLSVETCVERVWFGFGAPHCRAIALYGLALASVATKPADGLGLAVTIAGA